MKKLQILLASATLLFLGACSSSYHAGTSSADDVYYSSKDYSKPKAATFLRHLLLRLLNIHRTTQTITTQLLQIQTPIKQIIHQLRIRAAILHPINVVLITPPLLSTRTNRELPM
jgi:hypothetical protein